jgi:hypothetical protein
MIPMYNDIEYTLAKGNDKLLLECEMCQNKFTKTKESINQALYNPNSKNKLKFCSNTCTSKANLKKIKLSCTYCGNDIFKTPSELKKSKSGNYFCSKSCTTTYNNKNKTSGITRSKLEIWLEEQLTLLYPNLPIDFNKKDAIGSEFDIYIPTLNLAFELNGIFHYEPIFGVDKLDKTKLNDISKSKACFDAKIDLCIIDTSAQKYVKPSTSQKYLDIINNIIKERL